MSYAEDRSAHVLPLPLPLMLCSQAVTMSTLITVKDDHAAESQRLSCNKTRVAVSSLFSTLQGITFRRYLEVKHTHDGAVYFLGS